MHNDIYLERYFDNDLILRRFSTFEDLKKQLNEDLKKYDLKVKNYGFKTDFDNDFEDFRVMFTIGNDEEDIYDLDLWYAITRIGERIVVESNFDGV